ncbi:hypothetical protein PG996_013784 [Apiospora saccharicola]|uniref:Uncharacterized protein n=1 Tax=Apiospora saccharicola TaxID=335842 RepID=A0ABR1TGG0_9PEZI
MLHSLEQQHHGEDQMEMEMGFGGAHDIHLHLADVTHLDEPDAISYDYNRRHYNIRYDHTRITLPGADELPLLHCVRHLSFGEWRRTPDPSVPLMMAAWMPNLTTVDLVLDTEGSQKPPPPRGEGQDLFEALKAYSEQTQKVAHATLNMRSGGQMDALVTRQLNFARTQGHNLLGASLRGWSQRLASFRVRGVVDGSLFWPHPHEKGLVSDDENNSNNAPSEEPEWPHMQDIDVHAERYAPSGRWYFTRSEPAYPAPSLPDYTFESTGDDSDHDDVGRRFSRSVPHEETIQPLFAAWARALVRMPSLRTARLRFRIKFFHEGGRAGRWHSMEDWGVVYEAPGYESKDKNKTAWCGVLTPEEQRYRRLIFQNTGVGARCKKRWTCCSPSGPTAGRARKWRS